MGGRSEWVRTGLNSAAHTHTNRHGAAQRTVDGQQQRAGGPECALRPRSACGPCEYHASLVVSAVVDSTRMRGARWREVVRVAAGQWRAAAGKSRNIGSQRILLVLRDSLLAIFKRVFRPVPGVFRDRTCAELRRLCAPAVSLRRDGSHLGLRPGLRELDRFVFSFRFLSPQVASWSATRMWCVVRRVPRTRGRAAQARSGGFQHGKHGAKECIAVRFRGGVESAASALHVGICTRTRRLSCALVYPFIPLSFLPLSSFAFPLDQRGCILATACLLCARDSATPATLRGRSSICECECTNECVYECS